jgi:hypothetical protein
VTTVFVPSNLLELFDELFQLIGVEDLLLEDFFRDVDVILVATPASRLAKNSRDS